MTDLNRLFRRKGHLLKMVLNVSEPTQKLFSALRLKGWLCLVLLSNSLSDVEERCMTCFPSCIDHGG